jgi:SAM-dependent methyltransferase
MTQIPLRIASGEVFARTRDLFVRSAFHEDSVEARTTGTDAVFTAYPDGCVPADADAAELLIGLFLRAGAASKYQLTDRLGSQGFEDLLELGLLQPAEEDAYRATMRIRPMYGLHVVSDLWDVTAGPNQGLPDDVVFPPDIANTLSYLSYLPLTPCENFLEACGGAGAAALVAAQRYAKKAYSFDITERSTVCAAFSAKLNGLPDFEARCGDTFEPAAGQQFDRIAAHPPYGPVLRHTWIYQAGGPDGEHITRKHVEDLPKVLAPGGRFYCRALGTDRLNEPFEHRVRTWLGEHSDQFDVTILVLRVMDPMTSVMQAILRRRMTVEDLPAWENQMQALKILRFLPMWLVIQRHHEARVPFTVRRMRSKYTGPSELDWLLTWETARAKGQAEQAILMNPLTAAPVTHRVRNEIHEGQWQVASQQLRSEFPFECEWDVDAMAVFLLPRCDGKVTGLQLLRALIQEGSIRPDADPRRFASVLAELVSGGFLRVGGFEPAAPRVHVDVEA